MHVVTFYSYKGGTGRSMALVNVAVELAKSGLSVLIVDFDLEAPGLDTFNLPQPKGASKGLVDFLNQYLETGESPDVSEFVYTSPLPNTAGTLWVMPAGRSDRDYDKQVKAIDWRDLYENRHGYLLFEDLRAQWNELYKPDYVLIDSRTGHTDVGGICTRQLPDSVVLFFFPDEQNRRGLETMVNQIRGEATAARKKEIKLHYVMSRVPDLDDEDGIVSNAQAQISASLGFEKLSAQIHQYQSLTLLEQSVFTLDRPKTKLAHEYRVLAKEIRRDNLNDREVALEFLDGLAPHKRMRQILAKDLEGSIDRIQKNYPHDPEILSRLVLFLRQQRRFEEALALLDPAKAAGANSAEFLLASAEIQAIEGNLPAALRDIEYLKDAVDATYIEISAAARFLLRKNPETLDDLIEGSAFKRLEAENKYYIANELLGSREGLSVAVKILAGIVEQPKLDLPVRNDLVCALLGLGRFEAAINIISDGGKRSVTEYQIDEAFNFAMSKWGLEGSPSTELFHRVVELDRQDRLETPNGHQCLALALWASGDSESALTRVGEAWQKIVTTPRPEFSCWTYMRLPPDRFLQDVNEMRQLIEGEIILPRFIRENSSTEKK